MKTAAILLAPLVLAAAPANAAPPPNVATARIGETVRMRGLRFTPLRVVEDSRCPQNARCVWAGRVVLSVRIDNAVRDLTLGQPVQVAGGMLHLAAVLPAKTARQRVIPPRSYRFAFEFRRGAGTVLTSY